MQVDSETKVLSPRDFLPTVEVAGMPVRCIASNLRAQSSIDWTKLHPVTGIAHEGSILLGQVLTVAARREMEYIYGDQNIDVPLEQGDYIIAVVANRHSGTSEYGSVPRDGIVVNGENEIDLIAAGGVAGICLGVPRSLGTSPTKLRALGLLADYLGKPIDILDTVPPWDHQLENSAKIVLSLGTAAEIGKTTTATKIIGALKSLGVEKIGATKMAGTGRRRDITSLSHAGADTTFDFPDVGLATTYTSSDRFIPAIYTLINRINREGSPQIIIAECGGDIIEANIPALLQDENIIRHVAAIVHSSTDVLAIMGSLELYKNWGILESIPTYLTYPIQRNYVAVKERLTALDIHLPIFDPMDEVETSVVAEELMAIKPHSFRESFTQKHSLLNL